MRLSGLRAFRFVFEEGSIAAAALRLNLSPPAVSRLVSGLEEELGLALFLRSGRNLTPSPEGAQFYAQTHRLLASIDNLPSLARDIRDGQTQTVRLLSMPRLSSAIALPAIAALRNILPQLTVQLDVMSRRELKGEITRLNYDFAIAALPLEDTVATVETVATRKLGVIMRRDHPLADRGHLTPADLRRETMIALPPQTRHRQDMDDIFRSFSIQPRIRVIVSSIDIAVRLVAQGADICLADGITAHLVEASELCSVPLRPSRSVNYGLIHPALPRAHEHSHLIAETLRQQFAKDSDGDAALR